MQLHQLLRFINFKTPLIIYDIEGIIICTVNCKNDIDIDLYEYPILELNSGIVGMPNGIPGIFITIQK